MSDKVRVKSRGRDSGRQRTSPGTSGRSRWSAYVRRSNYGGLPPLALHCNPNFLCRQSHPLHNPDARRPTSSRIDHQLIRLQV